MSNDSRKIRFGLWYDFRNPTQWRQPADRLYREILDQIAWGENNGFDDVWLSEHHFIEDGYLPSILPAAAAIAARTNRIRIASGVLLMPFHNPIRLAEDVATVDVISGGRFELGVGIGFKREEFTGFGVSSKERGARTDQSLEIIRRALAGRPSLSSLGSRCCLLFPPGLAKAFEHMIVILGPHPRHAAPHVHVERSRRDRDGLP